MDWEVLLIQHQHGHWGFPKGHIESGEQPLEAAVRELEEETGLSLSKLLVEEPVIEKYRFTHEEQEIYKTVYYFIASVKGKVLLQLAEVVDYQWVPLKEAFKYITFPEAQQLSVKALSLIN